MILSVFYAIIKYMNNENPLNLYKQIGSLQNEYCDCHEKCKTCGKKIRKQPNVIHPIMPNFQPLPTYPHYPIWTTCNSCPNSL